MITFHASAVCRVRDGYTGRPLEGSSLLCAVDGAPARPLSKPGGYLILLNLSPGPHRLVLGCHGYQEEWVDFSAGARTQELEVTMKPGAGYPFQEEVVRAELTVTERGAPAAGRQLWLAAPGGPELKVAQTKAEAGSGELRIFCRGPEVPALPGAFLIADGENSEIVGLRTLEGETGALAAPLGRAHGRGRPLLPAQSYHTGPDGRLEAVFREPCAVEVCGSGGRLLASLQLAQGDNRHAISL